MFTCNSNLGLFDVMLIAIVPNVGYIDEVENENPPNVNGAVNSEGKYCMFVCMCGVLRD